jgi:hypothetical protein
MLTNDRLRAGEIESFLQMLLDEKQRLPKMASAALSLHKDGATSLIADACVQAIKNSGSGGRDA